MNLAFLANLILGTICSSVHPPSRVDCGYPGMKPLECARKGCCWDSSINGVHWCFYPAGFSVLFSIKY